jgi:hypothetical protein
VRLWIGTELFRCSTAARTTGVCLCHNKSVYVLPNSTLFDLTRHVERAARELFALSATAGRHGRESTRAFEAISKRSWLTVATLNSSGFENAGVKIVNPYAGR